MRFDFTLISTFLFASAVLADHSREDRSSQLFDVVEKRTSAISDSVQVASNIAGAVLKSIVAYPTYYNVTGVIVVPSILGQTGDGVSIWVGLDVDPSGTECGTTFRVGLICTMDSSGPLYTVAGQWLFEKTTSFTNVEVSALDVVQVTIGVSSDRTTGYATVENLTKKSIQTVQFNVINPLCLQSAGWIVEKMDNRTLANFTFVLFASPTAYSDKELNAGGSLVYDITREDGQALTVVQAYGDMIAVTQNYV
ncbi:peptidase A4 family-domain-containing protein [Boletus edulis]|uniref:Peptidase A4 family-domain-containing protein n=1 Tax=Boletus edulis BED1 TaxID=1328754 RepID=A0AAD4BPE0_BOLED|nr:peptidase A4 family-domain-containing protein [Boletus edulis]KAF8435741.1 peptidase A4 family-domain-containing protein [Boletus edulis BED1]